jgi:hypothetical protein
MVPSGLASFPFGLMPVPRALTEIKYKQILQFTVMPRGGHFAAFEEPQLLAYDIISFVRKVENMKDTA